MKCCICSNILINSTFAPCGCRYCYECIEMYVDKSEKYCPGSFQFCQGELIKIDRNIQIDQPMNVKILRCIVKCPQPLCGFIDKLINMGDYMRIWKDRIGNCPYVNIGCDNNRIIDGNVQDHLFAENYSHTKLLMEWMDNSRNEMESLKKDESEIRQENKCLIKEMEMMKLDADAKQVKYCTNYKIADLC